MNYHTWYFWSGSPTRSDFNEPRLLAPKYSDPLHSKCSAPLYSWSGSPTGSDYFSLYISSCFRLNKLLTNLTSLRQHHLQYTGGLAETQGLLLPSVIVTLYKTRYSSYRHKISSSQNFNKRLLFFSERSLKRSALSVPPWINKTTPRFKIKRSNNSSS